MSQGPRSIAVDSECAAAAQRAARLLESLGHNIEESHPPALDEPDALTAFVTVVAVSVARALETWGAKVGRPVLQDSVEPLTWALAEMARRWSSTRYLEAVESVHGFGRRLAAWWSRGFDLLLTPTTAEPAPLLGEMTSPPDIPLKGFLRAAPFGAFTSSFNMSGQPAVSLPLHWTRDGLPVGVQLVAAAGREDLLLRVASQLEAAAPWAHKRPPVSA